MPADSSAPPSADDLPYIADAVAHAIRWQAHVDAGRIGQRPAPDPAILANRVRTAAILGLRDRGRGIPIGT